MTTNDDLIVYVIHYPYHEKSNAFQSAGHGQYRLLQQKRNPTDGKRFAHHQPPTP